MARARNIKPGLFRNEILGIADPIYTIAFEGLWIYADREGRLEDRSIRLKADIFPYRDVPMESILDWLHKNGFIARYEVNGCRFIQVCNFRKHQNPHIKEGVSTIPAPCESSSEPVKHSASTVQEPDIPERAGRIPDSGFLIPLTDIPPMEQAKSVDKTVSVDNSVDPVVVFLQSQGIQIPNPDDPAFKRLRSQGADMGYWQQAADIAIGAGNTGFSYVLGIVKNKLAKDNVANSTVPSQPGRDKTLAKLDAEKGLVKPPDDGMRKKLLELSVAAKREQFSKSLHSQP
jgi:hypothetical protein